MGLFFGVVSILVAKYQQPHNHLICDMAHQWFVTQKFQL